jgi:hypothetical protein
MNTNLSYAMNHDTNEALVPPEMIRAGSAVVRSIIDVMLMYGVDKLEVGHHAHGSVILLSPRIRVLKTVSVPPWLDGSRKQAIYHLSHLMLIMGLLGVEVTPDDEELKSVEERWRSCERLSASATDDVAKLLAPEGAVQVESEEG